MSDKRDFICRGPNIWGRGATPRAAQQIAKRQAGSTWRAPENGKICFVIHSVPPGTTVNAMGGLNWTKPGNDNPLYAEPQLVGYYDVHGRIPTHGPNPD